MDQPTPQQCERFVQMANEQNMEMLHYVSVFSYSFLGKNIKDMAQMTTEEAKIWIEKHDDNNK